MSHPRDPVRIQTTRISPRPTRSNPPSTNSPGGRTSVSPPPIPKHIASSGSSGNPSLAPQSNRSRSGSTSRGSTPGATRRRSSESKENIPVGISLLPDPIAGQSESGSKGGKMNGIGARAISPASTGSNGQSYRDGSLEPDDSTIRKRVTRRTKSPSPSTASANSHPKSPGGKDYYNGLPTLPAIQDNDDPDCAISDSPSSPSSPSGFRPPPPAPSAATGTGERGVTRKRRSSSIKRKLSPGVVPVKAVDWEIPRKALHSSIGFLTLFLNHLNPPSTTPLLIFLLGGLLAVTITDFLRLKFPSFAEVWEYHFGFLMRESERDKINGVVWYLVGVCWVLGVYPRDVAVVSILTLSWSDTTASTIGRLYGRYTAPLPANFPGIKSIKFAPRKSLAGFLAASVTGAAICIGFWWRGSNGRWAILDGHWGGLVGTAGFVGVGGAVVEALGSFSSDTTLQLQEESGARFRCVGASRPWDKLSKRRYIMMKTDLHRSGTGR